MRKKLKVSERLACRVIGQVRTTQRYVPQPNPEREKIRERIVELATQYGRYGYKTITSMLQLEGFDVGKDSVHRVWREEGLQVPQKQPKRSRLWLTDGSCIRLRPTHKNHVWSYDFVSEQPHDGRKFRILNIIDEFTRECLASFVARRIRSQDVILILADLFIEHGIPEYIRSDNGPEFVARKLMAWFKTLNVKPLFIEKGSPWENALSASRWRNILFSLRSQGRHRSMEKTLQLGEASFESRRKTPTYARNARAKIGACQ